MGKTQRYITTSFWSDPFVRSLFRDAKLFYMYVLTNSNTNIAGIYEFDRELSKIDLDLDDDRINLIIKILEEKGKVYFLDGWVIVKSWPKHQKWDSKTTIKLGIDKCLKNTPKSILYKAKAIGYLYPISSEYLPYDYRPSYLEFDLDKDIDAVPKTTKVDLEGIPRVQGPDSGPALPDDDFDILEENVEDDLPPDDVLDHVDSEFPAPERSEAPAPGYRHTPIDDLWHEAVEVWNFNELPKARYMPTVTMTQKNRDIIVAAFSGRERNEVRDKIQEYASNLPEEKWQYRTIMSFLEKGVDRQYAKNGDTAGKKTKQKVFLCPECGIEIQGSACPKCFTNFGPDGKPV